MKKDNVQLSSFSAALKAGLDLSFKKLVKEKQVNDDVLVFSKNGKNIKVKARDIKL